MNCVFLNLHSGLGNRLFKLASAYGISKEQNKELYVNNILSTFHNSNSEDYMNTIFRNFKIKNITNDNDYNTFFEPEDKCLTFIKIKNNSSNLFLRGYFQNEKYFENYKKDIYNLFRMEEHRQLYLTNKYNNLNNSYFIHIRRGDYILPENDMHNIDLIFYYKKCLQQLKINTNLLVFSDDIEYCKNMDIFKNIPFNIIFIENENEINSIYLMSLCFLGGICSNSSYSWWGSYLNENKNKLVMFPNKWFNNDWECDIFFKGSVVVDI